MSQEQPNSKERPKVPLLSGLQNMLLRIKEQPTIETGMVTEAIGDKKITTRSELEALRDNLEMQINEELEALKNTDFTEENDSFAQIIKNEIGAIDEALASGKFE